MEKIETENNLNLAVYVNGKPNLALMPIEALDALCVALLSLLESEVDAL